MGRQFEAADVVVEGVVQSTGTGAQGDRTYVRFAGAQGQVAVTIPGHAGGLPGAAIKAGDRVRVLCDVRPGKDGACYLEAYEVVAGSPAGPKA